MRIYAMTAVFGKLEQETLTLKPGLNVIEAPNEWGKSTWCAFLIAMLYGLDTRAKTTKTALADKEKYAPWSGSAMAGRIDLHWKGRDITIERSTRGRTPMGVFRAYETETGLAVPELTAGNCGSVLLGVEQSVFRRTGFIRQADLPVTQDDALRRRLNALVTTGDESGDSDRLAAELKELKNKCRYNRSGLLPQAEGEKRELEEKIEESETLSAHSGKLRERLGEVKNWRMALQNHADALQYAAAEADAGRVAQARNLRDQAERTMTALEQLCSQQPSREAVEKNIRTIQDYREAVEDYQMKAAGMRQPAVPLPPEPFRGQSPEEAAAVVRQDSHRHGVLSGRKLFLVFLFSALICLTAGLTGLATQQMPLAALLAGGVVLLVLALRNRSISHRERELLERKYGSSEPARWQALVDAYKAEQAAYDRAVADYRSARGDLDIRHAFLQKQRETLFGGRSPERMLEACLKMRKRWEDYDRACREFRQAEKHLQILREMAQGTGKKPAFRDELTCSEEETRRLLEETQAEQQRLQNRLGQYQGRMEALGDRKTLREQLCQVEQRIRKLEEMYEAASLALETLDKARQELQRKFAPRISSRAGELLSHMTAGRYEHMTLREDLSLLVGGKEETTLREILWRSDGTMDQLYLALRLAVAEALAPEAPLVLDDALVRFDDVRLKSAMEILQETARQKQVILFTCQHREQALLQSETATAI